MKISKLKSFRQELWQAVRALWIAWKHLSKAAPIAAYCMLAASLLSSAIAPLAILVYQQLVNVVASGHGSIDAWLVLTILIQSVDGGVFNGAILGGWDLWIQELTYQTIRIRIARKFATVLDVDSARVLRGEYEEIRDDLQRAYWSMSDNFFGCVEYLGTTIGLLFLLVQLPPLLIILILARASFATFVAVKFGWGSYQGIRGKDTERKRVFSGYHVVESDTFHDELHHHGKGTPHFLAGLENSEKVFLEKLKSISRGRSLWKGVSTLVGALVTGAIYWYARIDGIGLFVRETNAATSFSSSLVSLMSTAGSLSSGAQTALRVEEFMKHKPSIGSEVATTHGREVTIKFQDLTVEFPALDGDKVVALQGICLNIEPGEKIALMGTNGSGKSTLMNLLQGLNRDRIVKGRLDIQGIEVRNWRVEELDSRVGVCRQDIMTFPVTAAQNIAFSAGEQINQDLILEVARMIGFEQELTQVIGLDSLLRQDAGGKKLSGGTAQKMQVLRAMYQYFANPDVWLMLGDEATSAVYGADADKIYEAVLNLGGSLVLVTHALHLAMKVGKHDGGRIISMDHGFIVEDGSHAALVAARGPYYELLKQQGLLGPEEL